MASFNNKSISSWIRQARYRAKNVAVLSDIEIADIISILEEWDYKCAYTGEPADCFDHAFPIKIGAPNMPANILPCTKKIKKLKKTNDIMWMHTAGHITGEQYTTIIKSILKRRGHEWVRERIRLITGE